MLDTLLVMGFNSIVNYRFRQFPSLPSLSLTFLSAAFLMSVYAAREQRLEEPAPTLEGDETSTEIESIVEEWTDPSQIQGSPAESVEYYGFDNVASEELELLDVAGDAVDEGIFSEGDPEKWAGMFQDFGFSIRSGAQYRTNGRGGGSQDGSGDVVFSISPTLSYNSGGGGGGPASIGVTYSPSAIFHMDDSSRNRLNHSFNLNAGYQFPKTSIGVSAGFSLSDTGDSFLTGRNVEDQANNTDRYFEDGTSTTSYNLGLNLSHSLTGKSSLGFGLSYSDTLFDDNGIDRSTTSTNISWRYQITDKINAGPYVSGEWSGVGGGGDQTAYGVGTSLNYQIGAKTSIGGSIGMQNRSFSGEGSVGDKAFLTYDLNGGYAVTSKIRLSTSFYRSVQPSFTEFDEATTATGMRLGVGYQCTDRISTNASVNYSMDDSISTLESTTSSSENQNYISVSLGANWSIGDHWVLGANFSWRQNNSDNSTQGFDSMVTGVSATFDF